MGNTTDALNDEDPMGPGSTSWKRRWGIPLLFAAVAAVCGVRAVACCVATAYHSPSGLDRAFTAGLLIFAFLIGLAVAALRERVAFEYVILGLICYATCSLYAGLWLVSLSLCPGVRAAVGDTSVVAKVLVDQLGALPVATGALLLLAAVPEGREMAGRIVQRSSRELNLSRTPVATLFAAPPIALLAYLCWQFLDFDSARAFAEEDGLAEWATVGAYAVGLAVLSRATVLALRSGRTATAGIYCLLVLGAVVIVGEEVAWFSRFYSLGQSLRMHNTQGEITLHNVGAVQERFPLWLGRGAYGLSLLIVLTALLPADHKWRPSLRLLVPHLVVLPAFAALAASEGRLGAIFWTVLPDKGSFTEIEELLLGLAFVVYAWLNTRELGRETRKREPQQTAPD